MELIEVTNHTTLKAFHSVPHLIYKDDPKYIFALEEDIEFVFSPEKNRSYEEGEAVRYVLMDEHKAVGRIAVFYDMKKQHNAEYPVGGFGFFECIENRDAAFMLFDKAKSWLDSKGMMAMDGPINFGERDKFWGLLVEGFEEPTYLENYHKPYYKQFFDEYGFKLYIEQMTFRIDRESFDAKRFTKVAEWISRKPGFRFEHLKMSQLDRYAEDFVTVYNQAWEKFENFQPMTTVEIKRIIKAMRHILVEDFIWFGYVNNEPAGIMVMIPDVNQLLKSLKGKLGILQKLQFFYLSKVRKMTRAKGLVFGVVPKYQKFGVETVMIYKFYKAVSKTWQYHTVELSWIGKFNTRMATLMNNINAKVSKVHHTYRFLFDENLPFEPYRIEE